MGNWYQSLDDKSTLSMFATLRVQCNINPICRGKVLRVKVEKKIPIKIEKNKEENSWKRIIKFQVSEVGFRTVQASNNHAT